MVGKDCDDGGGGGGGGPFDGEWSECVYNYICVLVTLWLVVVVRVFIVMYTIVLVM